MEEPQEHPSLSPSLLQVSKEQQREWDKVALPKLKYVCPFFVSTKISVFNASLTNFMRSIDEIKKLDHHTPISHCDKLFYHVTYLSVNL